jgi:hypothetical protein
MAAGGWPVAAGAREVSHSGDYWEDHGDAGSFYYGLAVRHVWIGHDPRSAERVVWIDAKYKPHLQLLAHRGWSGVSEEIRHEHCADEVSHVGSTPPRPSRVGVGGSGSSSLQCLLAIAVPSTRRPTSRRSEICC